MKRILIISILMMIVGCSLAKTIADFKKPTVKTTDPEITNLSFDDVKLSFDVIIDNPNPLSVNFSGMSYDFIVDKQKLVSGAKKDGFELKGNANSKIAIPIEIAFSDVFKTIGNIISTNEIDYNVKAEVGFKIPILGDVNIPVSVSGKIPIPKPPTLTVASLKKKSLSFSGAEFELVLKVNNPNVFPIDLSNFNYSFDVNNKKLVSGKSYKKKVNCLKNSETEIPIKIKLDLLSLGSAAYSMLKSGKDLEYSFNSSFDLGTGLSYLKSKSFSLNDSGKLDILK